MSDNLLNLQIPNDGKDEIIYNGVRYVPETNVMESSMQSKFKIGDVVRVINSGKLYLGYAEMVKKLGLKNWQRSPFPDDETAFIVVGMSKHQYEDVVVYAIKSLQAQSEYLINEEGIEIVPPEPEKPKVRY